MKKSIIPVLFIIISLALLASGVSAQSPKVTPAITSEASASPTEKGFAAPATETQTEEYILPYPGILLDHPLYFLKNLRDQVMEFLISDPTKKAEFSLLQSDKFLAMSQAYVDKGNWDMVTIALIRSQMAIACSQATPSTSIMRFFFI